ncbi:hypothetical protein AZF37_00180 [endosymbiont 'TC1' of Trimyema compressum]|uniref:DUF1934 domain-containing protein n=1 Tax=endosymbiont 'TC1' of Trimyema compressum TaxID=243899 RepID=UPI0007F15DA9|nr:DUF1934 domain-containing protein [endosymbiont 'TC1' of Trimyema compressum]AMP19800.1 hypothetical protein AZF37_00180 [endosymbiont 'TC1' of Trimyema compressum]
MFPIDIILNTSEGKFHYQGTLKRENSKTIIQYEEQIIETKKDTVVFLVEENKIVVKRLGGEMIFCEDEEKEFHYETPYGFLVFQIKTHQIIKEKDKITICYSLCAENEKIKEEKIILSYYER